ncbi:MAG: hypothetical protein ACTS3R_00245 [Inquilinaceae bacterium]
MARTGRSADPVARLPWSIVMPWDLVLIGLVVLVMFLHTEDII